jgi:hypothetical protein
VRRSIADVAEGMIAVSEEAGGLLLLLCHLVAVVAHELRGTPWGVSALGSLGTERQAGCDWWDTPHAFNPRNCRRNGLSVRLAPVHNGYVVSASVDAAGSILKYSNRRRICQSNSKENCSWYSTMSSTLSTNYECSPSNPLFSHDISQLILIPIKVRKPTSFSKKSIS